MPAAPSFAMVLYAASVMALAVCACLGVPWSSQGLGALVFLSAFPFLWLNERREARMMALLQTALRKASVVEPGAVDPANEGHLLFLCGPLAAGDNELLESPRWGVEAPDSAAALRVQVEQFQPPKQWSWQHCLRAGTWLEEGAPVASEERRAAGPHVGAFRLDSTQLDNLDSWEPFVPRRTERLDEVLQGKEDHGITAPISMEDARVCGCCVGGSQAPNHQMAKALGLRIALPFPGEYPIVEAGGSILFYPMGGGTLTKPRLGDVRVQFLHLPCSQRTPFTAVGVQRADTLQPFRFRQPPPPGLDLGISGDEDFNLGHFDEADSYLLTKFDGGKAGYLPVNNRVDGGYPAPTAEQVQGHMAMQQGIQNSMPRWLPFGLRALLAACLGAMEGWRHVLHRAAPEVLPCLAPGQHSRCSYFIRAHGMEIFFAWRLRFLGFLLMTAGAEIGLWQWAAELAVLGGVFAQALWAAAVVGAGGFTTLTAALGTIFYRPVAGTLWLVSGVALFAALFGWVTLMLALGCVASCMALLLTVLFLHLMVPC